ncbi:MAG: cysteine desulfurase [Candidatus Schekmanbacteria bacterium]|nr:cysteine desulfurase [Candidatus Schekmanbacteria bacterium]
MNKRIFFDHASATPLDARVLDAMLPYLQEEFGNPSSYLHSFGQQPCNALDKARRQVAAMINARPDEIIFTSGGTEANNLAVKGIALANEGKGKEILVSEIEHYSVLFAAQSLKRWGFEVKYLPVDKDGLLDPQDVRRAINPKTCLVCVMQANNEIGVIQDIPAISAITKKHGVSLHCDAVASAGTIPVDVQTLGVDSLSLSAQQFYGPKGTGALYLRKGVKIETQMQGGHQEMGRRSGTENVAGIVGLGAAAEIAVQELPQNMERLIVLRDRLLHGLKERIDYFNITGHPTRRLPGHVSFWVEFVEGESLLLCLDLEGIASASGSACSSNLRGQDEYDLAASHVLTAIGVPPEICHGSIAFTLGQGNTQEDVDYTLDVMPKIVARLRQMSPLYADKLRPGK